MGNGLLNEEFIEPIIGVIDSAIIDAGHCNGKSLCASAIERTGKLQEFIRGGCFGAQLVPQFVPFLVAHGKKCPSA